MQVWPAIIVFRTQANAGMEKTYWVAGLDLGILLGDSPGLLCHPTMWPQLVSDSFLRISLGGKPGVSSTTWSGGLQTWYMQIWGWQPSGRWLGEGERKRKPSSQASLLHWPPGRCVRASLNAEWQPYWSIWATCGRKKHKILLQCFDIISILSV